MSDLTRIFTPTNDEGKPDQRFREDVEWVFNRVGSEVLEGLKKFEQQTDSVNTNYAKYAYSLVKAFLERNTEIDHWESSTPTNQYKWRSKKIRFWSEGEMSNDAFQKVQSHWSDGEKQNAESMLSEWILNP